MKDDDTKNKIRCRECGKLFSFLAPHLRRIHQISPREYRERWEIPLHIPLASAEYSHQCRENILSRIHKGEIVPAEQLRLMKEARENVSARRPATTLQKKTSGKTALTYRIWIHSPTVKTISEELRNEALQRMKARAVSGEKVEDISRSLNVSLSYLYRLLRPAEG